MSEPFAPRNESIYSDIDLNDEPACLPLAKESEDVLVKKPEDSSVFKVRIVEFAKRGGFFDVHFVYKIETEVSGVQGYSKPSYEVWRRFSDFMDLHEKMVAKYRPRGLLIPQPPEKKVSVMAKAMTNTHTSQDPELLQRARHFERFLNRLIQHPRIRSDCDVRDFLTMEADLKPMAKQDVLSAVGVMKAFHGFKEAIDKFTIPIEETDQWFEKSQTFYEELDSSIRMLYKQATVLVSNRKEMAMSGEMLAKSLSRLAASEDSTTLSLALTALTDTYEQLAMIWSTQAFQHDTKFQESLDEYIGLIDSLRDVFDERIHVWQQLKKSQKTLEELKKRMETCDDVGKVDELNREIEEMERAREQFGRHFDDISMAIRDEVARFENAREVDLKTLLVDFMEDMIRAHAVMSKLWEQFDPYAHKILGN